MAEMTFFELYDYIAKVGFGGLLLGILYANWKRIFYWRWYVDELRADRDAWKATAQKYGAITETSLGMAAEKK